MERQAWAWWVGIDWASEAHAVCVVDASGTVRGRGTYPHSGTGVAALTAWLTALTGAPPAAIAIGLEVPHGAVVESLLASGYAVWAINPKQLDRFRDRFTVAGAKDDPRDAYLLADALRTEGRAFRRLQVEEDARIELRTWARLFQDLQEERVRLGHRVREQLQRYYPQMLTVVPDVGSAAFCALWTHLPTPAAAATGRVPRVARVLRQARVRRLVAAAVLGTLREPPLAVSAGTVAAATAAIAAAVARLTLVLAQLKACRQALRRLLGELAAVAPAAGRPSDVAILQSVPGIGPIVLSTLVADAGDLLARRDYAALRALVGVAPITKNSGKRSGPRSCVVMRQACHRRLRAALYHWARVASQRDPRSRAADAAFRARGRTHGGALRCVGDRLLAMVCAMLRHGTLFDATRRQVA